MQNHERQEIESFVHAVMQKTYGCNAYPLPERVLIARSSGDLTGAIAISEPSENSLPIEWFYEIDEKSFPGGGRPQANAMIQFGRWIGKTPSVAEILMREAVHYSLNKHYEWAISEVKPQVKRRFRQLGIELIVLRGTLRWERVPEAIRPYYTEPFPMLAVASLANLDAALRKRSLRPSP